MSQPWTGEKSVFRSCLDEWLKHKDTRNWKPASRLKKSFGRCLGEVPQTVWLTLGVLTVIVKGRGVRSEVADGIRRYFRAFVLACACFVAIYVLSDVSRPTRTGFTCEFS